uniref:Uncharacterized protein n=1 Tax=Rhizophora mucronata TaxID=61149 RepID=A0A2P2NW96_RHIMU
MQMLKKNSRAIFSSFISRNHQTCGSLCRNYSTITVMRCQSVNMRTRYQTTWKDCSGCQHQALYFWSLMMFGLSQSQFFRISSSAYKITSSW